MTNTLILPPPQIRPSKSKATHFFWARCTSPSAAVVEDPTPLCAPHPPWQRPAAYMPLHGHVGSLSTGCRTPLCGPPSLWPRPAVHVQLNSHIGSHPAGCRASDRRLLIQSPGSHGRGTSSRTLQCPSVASGGGPVAPKMATLFRPAQPADMKQIQFLIWSERCVGWSAGGSVVLAYEPPEEVPGSRGGFWS